MEIKTKKIAEREERKLRIRETVPEQKLEVSGCGQTINMCGQVAHCLYLRYKKKVKIW